MQYAAMPWRAGSQSRYIGSHRAGAGAAKCSIRAIEIAIGYCDAIHFSSAAISPMKIGASAYA
jgi:hypothetical protein